MTSSPTEEKDGNATTQKTNRRVSFCNILEVHESEAVASEERLSFVNAIEVNAPCDVGVEKLIGDKSVKQQESQESIPPKDEIKQERNGEQVLNSNTEAGDNKEEFFDDATQNDEVVCSPERLDCKDEFEQDRDEKTVKSKTEDEDEKEEVDHHSLARIEEPNTISMQSPKESATNDGTSKENVDLNETNFTPQKPTDDGTKADVDENPNEPESLEGERAELLNMDENHNVISPIPPILSPALPASTTSGAVNKTLDKFYTSSLAIRRSSVDDVNSRKQNGARATSDNKNSEKTEHMKIKRRKAAHTNKIQKRLDQIKAINERNLAAKLASEKKNNNNNNSSINRTFEPAKNAEVNSKSSQTSFKCTRKPMTCTYKSLDAKAIGDTKIPIKTTSTATPTSANNKKKPDQSKTTAAGIKKPESSNLNQNRNRTEISSTKVDNTDSIRRIVVSPSTLNKERNGNIEDKKQITKRSLGELQKQQISKAGDVLQNEGVKNAKKIPPPVAKKPLSPRASLEITGSKKTSEQKIVKNIVRLTNADSDKSEKHLKAKQRSSVRLTTGNPRKTTGSTNKNKDTDKKETKNSDQPLCYRPRTSGKSSAIARRTELLMRAAKGEKHSDDSDSS